MAKITVEEKSVLLNKYENIKGYSSNLFDNEEWREFDAFCGGYNLAVELLNEKASEPEWVVDRFPETAGFYLVTRKVLDTHTDEFLNDRYIDEVVIIFYFKERNVTGWEKDWTNKPSNVIGWMPLPNKPV